MVWLNFTELILEVFHHASHMLVKELLEFNIIIVILFSEQFPDIIEEDL